MLPPEPTVLLARQAFTDAQDSMLGALTGLGFYTVGWYGTEVDDERGSFAIVNTAGPLLANVGDFLNVRYHSRDVDAYVIASRANLLTDIALTRRTYMALASLAVEPIRAKVSLSQ